MIQENRPPVSLFQEVRDMNLFLAIFFFVLGVAGLVLGSNAGVFAGLSLFSMQIIKLMKASKIGLIIIAIAGLAGIVFFAAKKEWLLLFIFIVLHSYNYWLSMNLQEKKEEDLHN